MAGLSLLAYMQQHNAGFPAGGSLEFARAIERRYLELGGEIHYKSQVEKILVETTGKRGEDRAAGVRLYNDSEYRGDYVISAADGRATIYEMLAGNIPTPRSTTLRRGISPSTPSSRFRWGSTVTSRMSRTG